MNSPVGAPLGTTSGLSLVDLLSLVLRHRRLLGLAVLFVTLPAVAIGKLFPEYEAIGVFLPESSGASSRLAGVAAQFGFVLPTGDEAESPDFYAELVESREILGALIQKRFAVRRTEEPADTVSGTLIELYGVKGDRREELLQEAIGRLEGDVSVSRDIRTGMVTVKTTARWADLAEQITREVLVAVNEFNLRRRQTRAAAERQFVEGRMMQARSELEATEAELERFFTKNRTFRESPRLVFEADRLQRRVDLRQQVFVSLSQAADQARIEEVRNTPVVTVVDPPEGSAERRPTALRNGIVGILLGGVLGFLAALWREYLDRERVRNPAGYAELQRQWRGMLSPLTWGRHPTPSIKDGV